MVDDSEVDDIMEKALEDRPKLSKSVHMQALQTLITDKKERVKKILSKPATLRIQEELNEVASLLSNVEFLKLFKDKLIELAKYMTLETYLGKKTIVEQGSEGDKFYFILDGKVSIFVKAFNDMTGNEFFKHVVDLNPGAYFGELSLIYNAPRTATVTSCDRADLIVISRYAYEKIIRDFHIDQMDKMITFYMNFPLFEEMSKELIFTIVTRSRFIKVSTKETIVKQGEIPKTVYFIRNGKFKVVKEIVFSKKQSPSMKKSTSSILQTSKQQESILLEDDQNEVRFLELDELESGDVFCHCNVIDKKPMDHSIVSVLPSEVYAVPASDFLMLCKDLLFDFKRYNKPYPSSEQIISMFEQEKKWSKYKEYLVKKIQAHKKINKGLSFDYVLRSPNLHFPREVQFVPESKIKLYTHKKKVSKDDLHKRFLRQDSDDSLHLQENDLKSPISITENATVIRDPGMIGISNIDVQSQDDRKFKLLGLNNHSFQPSKYHDIINKNLNKLDQIIKQTQLTETQCNPILEESLPHNQKTVSLLKATRHTFSQPDLRTNHSPSLLETRKNSKINPIESQLPSIQQIRSVINSFKCLGSEDRKQLKKSAKISLKFSPALIESYSKYGSKLKGLKITQEQTGRVK